MSYYTPPMSDEERREMEYRRRQAYDWEMQQQGQWGPVRQNPYDYGRRAYEEPQTQLISTKLDEGQPQKQYQEQAPPNFIPDPNYAPPVDYQPPQYYPQQPSISPYYPQPKTSPYYPPDPVPYYYPQQPMTSPYYPNQPYDGQIPKPPYTGTGPYPEFQSSKMHYSGTGGDGRTRETNKIGKLPTTSGSCKQCGRSHQGAYC